MPDYFEIHFDKPDDHTGDILIALLAEMNDEGFVEESPSLKAYIRCSLYDEAELIRVAASQKTSFSIRRIEYRNWNAEWESNFHPVVIEHPSRNVPWVGIRAGFHKKLKNVEHEIIITPKMSFGTGHHATTEMMIRMMGGLEFSGKAVLDFGTGTGILSILSEKIGAAKITAIDNDDQSIENATENFQSNNCAKISLLQASSADINGDFDIILANVIKDVILGNLSAFAGGLNDGGQVLLSGLLSGDEGEIKSESANVGLFVEKKLNVGDWICLQMSRQPVLSNI